MTPGGTNAKVSIEVGWPQGLTDHQYFPEIRIVDDVSNQTVAFVQLTENEWLRLCHGTYISHLDGWIVPEHLRDRLGKQFEHTSIPVPKDLKWTHQSTDPITRPSEEMNEWAREKVDELNSSNPEWRRWTQWKLYHGQGGWVLNLQRWVPIPDAEAVKVEA